MARTRNRLAALNGSGSSRGEGSAARVAAAAPLVPRRRGGVDSHRQIDMLLNGDASTETELAWYFYSRIPELRYIARYVANSVSQARLFVGRVTADPYNPERVEEAGHPAVELLEGFAGGFEGQAELLDRLGLHLTIAGDSILAGPVNPGAARTPHEPFNEWRVYSTTELISRQGVVFYRRFLSHRDEPLPAGVLPVRIWRPHPRRWESADSPVLSSFTVLREIDLLDQHVHASAVSRLAGAGILGIPDEITLPTDEVETEGVDVDPFIEHLSEVMSIAIKNRESASALVPIMVRGPAEAINAIKLFTFDTPFSERVPELRNVGLRRLALGMDVPPEVLLGMSESTQWSAWQTDESTVRLHTVPLLQLMVNALTIGWLRPTLRKLRLPSRTENEIDNLTIWFDLSNLRVRPNVTEEAQSLYDRFEVGGDTLRITTGFTESEKPTKSELEEQILLNFVRTSSPELRAYAINAMIARGMVDLPPILDSGNNPEGRPGNPEGEDIEGPRSVPGDRSRERQVSPPPPPDVDTDPNDNEVGRP